MPKIRSTTIVSAALCVAAAGLDLAAHELGWSLNHEILHLTAVLTGFLAVVSHYAKVATDQITETAEDFRTTVADTTEHFRRTITEEHKILHRSIVAEIENFGEQRTIDGHLAAERRRVNERQSGQETVDLHHADPVTRRRNNVTPLLRNRG